MRRLKTDILILGSGGAGLFAALHAHQKDPSLSITIAVKGLLGKCGCTRMVQGGYNVALAPEDSVERHFMDTIEGGKWLPHQELAWTLVAVAVERIRYARQAEFERLVRVELVPALGALKPDEVTKRQIRGLYDQIERRSASVAKHALAVLKMLYTWASDEDHVDAVPAFPKRGTQSNKRTRVLEESELRAVMRALDSGLSEATKPRPGAVAPMAEAFRLVLITAQRRGEVLSMRWANITEEKDGTWWTIPPERSKGGRAHRVPLTAPAVESLKRLHTIAGAEEYLFPAPREKAKAPFVTNPQKAAARLWKSSKVKGATVHDMRRTAATYMVRLAVPRLVVGRILGHSDSDVTGRYDVHAYDREKRAALQRWAAELQRIATAKARKAAERRVLPWAK
jgi:integrase